MSKLARGESKLDGAENEGADGAEIFGIDGALNDGMEGASILGACPQINQ